MSQRFKPAVVIVLGLSLTLNLLSPTVAAAAVVTGSGQGLGQTDACLSAKSHAKNLVFLDQHSRVSYYGECDCRQITHTWICSVEAYYDPGSGGTSSSGGGSDAWSRIGDPGRVPMCTAVYANISRLNGGISPQQGRALTAANNQGGADAARPLFYSLKDRVSSGDVSRSELDAFALECDRRHGFGWFG